VRIGVAMSGGVDSSVAARLLREEGHEVEGFTMRHFDDLSFGFGPDEGVEAAVRDAADVCRQLDMPHQVIDVRQPFRDIVLRDFISEYERGRTPNPCCLCNPTVKWGFFLDAILDAGMDAVATGHYVRLRKTAGRAHLYRGEAHERDQSYMLWGLSQQQLQRTLFPCSVFDKRIVRSIAHNVSLKVAQKGDSQDICFVREHYRDFLMQHTKPLTGLIVYKNGTPLGEHQGIQFYTVGQRRGLGINWGKSLYVMDIDPERRQVIVTDDLRDLARRRFCLSRVNWIAEEPPEVTDLRVQVRYNAPAAPVKELVVTKERIGVVLNEPEAAVTLGQSAVFYRGEELLGGGIIERWQE